MTKLFVTVLLPAFLAGCSPDERRGEDLPLHPNFLLIITEDISPMLSCYGDSTVSTPSIDRLAAEGTVFTRVFSTSGVCAPSRSAIITGMYPASVGSNHMRTRISGNLPGFPVDAYEVVMPPEVRCFTEYLRKAGYYCTNQGKRDWQFGKQLTAFDDYGKGGAHYRNRAPGQPFLAIFNIFCTHESQVWQRSDHPLRCSPENVPVPPYFPGTDTVRSDIARVYSNITEMDSIVGSLIGELEEHRLLDSTWVIFLSDHGGPLPRQKREILASGLHVPMIIRPPGGRKDISLSSGLVSFVDVAPTILSLAGVGVPEHMHGRAFLGNDECQPRKYVFGARDRIDSEPGRARSVCDGRFVYVRYDFPEKPWIQDISYRKNIPMMQQLIHMHNRGELDSIQSLWFMEEKPAEMLFDLAHDPYEIHNLAADPLHSEKLAELRKALEGWETKYGDMGQIPERELVESWWPGFQQPQTVMPEIRPVGDSLTISCTTRGASVAWQIRTDGKQPDPSEPNGWHVYTGPVAVGEDATLFAVANRIGYKNSKMATYARHHLQAERPGNLNKISNH